MTNGNYVQSILNETLAHKLVVKFNAEQDLNRMIDDLGILKSKQDRLDAEIAELREHGAVDLKPTDYGRSAGE